MIALDTNILVALHREDSPYHEQATRSWHQQNEGGVLWAIPWPCLHEFFAIVTHPRIFVPPTPVKIALSAIEAWTHLENCRLLSETTGYFSILADLVLSAEITGPRIHDARIAALCLHHEIRLLWTADRDFSRFPKLKIHNPLLPEL